MQTKTIIFYKEINFENVYKLINEIEEKKKNYYIIYFSTNGGEEPATLILIDYINKNQKKFILIANNRISSAGFNIFFTVKCKRRIMPHTTSTIHLATIASDFRELNKQYSTFSKITYEELKEQKEKYLSWLKDLGLKKEEIYFVSKGEDVVLNCESLNKILKKQEKNESTN